MRRVWLGLLIAGFAASAGVARALPPSSTAPDFKGVDSNGVQHSLSEYRGKFVVLEWANQGCPYEQKHYLSGNMESLQKQWTGKGVVWLSIISSAPGEQGYVTPAQENAYLAQVHADPTAVLMDPQGKLGRLYNARTTPQMIVIDPNGKVIYDGAIDDRPTPDPEDVKGANNYVTDALTEAMAGKPVSTPFTRPYGCGVKYPN